MSAGTNSSPPAGRDEPDQPASAASPQPVGRPASDPAADPESPAASPARPRGKSADSRPTSSRHHGRESWKETFESVSIALVLAFVFRAFVVEAFVIPTGSMADTLMGRHYEILCDRCGYGPWPLGIPKDPEDGRNQPEQPDPVCPNCDHHIRGWRNARTPVIPEVDRNAESADPAHRTTGQKLAVAWRDIPPEESALIDFEGTPRREGNGRWVLAGAGTGDGTPVRDLGIVAGGMLRSARPVDKDGNPLLDRQTGKPKTVLAVGDLPESVAPARAALGEDWAGRLDAVLGPQEGRRVRVRGRLAVVDAAGTLALVPECLLPAAPSQHSGDRILVLKYLYEFTGPRRWDVVVFRFPGNPKENYIKRLVGLPGESVMIVDGDVWTSRDGGKTFAIARKPLEAPGVQEALWHLVHTSDFPVPAAAKHAPSARLVKGWEAGDGAGWTDLDGKVFRFESDAASPATARWVQYVNGNYNNRGATGAALRGREIPIFDSHSYNGVSPSATSRSGEHDLPPAVRYGPGDHEVARVVSDLRLSFDLVWQAGEGWFQAALTKYGDRFTLRIHPDGKVALHHTAVDVRPGESDTPAKVASVKALPRGAPVRVSLSNADHVVEVRINGDVVASLVYEPADLRRLLADDPALWEPKLLPRIEVAATRGRLELRHVRIDRDVYYTQRDGGFGPLRAKRNNPIHLSAGAADRSREYFVLGDNSNHSQDGRSWSDDHAALGAFGRRIDKSSGRKTTRLDYQLGTVPEENLTGKAFFVYWPSGYYLWGDRWPVLPRADKWRLIH